MLWLQELTRSFMIFSFEHSFIKFGLEMYAIQDIVITLRPLLSTAERENKT